MTPPVRLLVVGGGIAGLAAAWEAVQLGADVDLVERTDRVGGKVRTERVDGCVVEHGPDAVVAYRPAALQLAREVGLGDDIVTVQPGRTVQMRVGQRMHPLPDGMGMVLPTRLRPLLTTPILSWRDKLRAGLDLVQPRQLGTQDVAIGAFLRRRLGAGVVTRLADPLVGGIYGASVDELSLDAVLPSLRSSEREHRSLVLASLAQGRAARRAGTATPGAVSSPFRSLRAGMGSLPDRVATQLLVAGAAVRTGVSVTALSPRGDGTVADFADGSHERYDAVVVATAGVAEPELLRPHAPGAAAYFDGVTRSTTSVVTFAYSADALPPVLTQGWLDAGPAPVTGVTVSSTKWPDRAPAGVVLVRGFVPARLGPLADAPDDDLVAAFAAYLQQVLATSALPSRHWVSRWRRAMPRYAVGHLDRVAALEAALASHPTWHVAGSAVRGVGVPDCVADGRHAARAVLERVRGRTGSVEPPRLTPTGRTAP